MDIQGQGFCRHGSVAILELYCLQDTREKTAREAQPRRLIPGKGHLRTVIYSGSKAACNPVWGLLQSLVECTLEAFFCNCFNIPRDLGGAVMQLWSVFRL